MRNEIIEQHYRHHYKILVKRATYRVPNHSLALAEEVVQEAYLRALRYWKTYDPNKNDFGAWFNRIYNSCVSNCIRSEAGHSNPSFDDEDDHLEPFILNDDVDIPKEIAIRVQAAIKSQKSDVSEVLHMFFNLGMKPAEISECTNLTNDNVRKIISRFRIKWGEENIF